MSTKLGIIGCGKMGSALLKGAIEAGAVSASEVSAFDHYQPSAEALTSATGANLAGSNVEVVENSDAILLCVKPQDMLAALTEIGTAAAGKLFISIAAGIKIEAIEAAVDAGARVIRIMPNTPALISHGAAAYALGSSATAEDAAFAESLMNAVGSVIEVAEKLLDTVTGLSGSGPAYVYTIIEALSDGGVLCGLPKDKAIQLAAQTVAGAANMVLQTGQHPAVLRDQVTSPGGTTIAGLQALEEGNLRATLISAVEAATERAKELGES
ncbi:MAG: pyrroline-5-carboxylate reductase [Verrucomicrobiales bacterium]|jgi:pyrroline-5-carboxylate reductase